MVYSVNNKKKIKTKKYLPQIIEVNKTVEEIVDIESRLVAKLAEMDVAMKTKDFKPCPSQACFWCAF